MINKFEQMREQLKGGVQVVAAPQLFPTPPQLVERMIDEAEIESSHQILEPSAGTGRILDGINCGDVVAIEYDSQLASALVKSYPEINIYCSDFTCCSPNYLGKFDRVIMNPPFKGGQDVEHVLHAYEFLKDGGRLVAIMCEGPFFRSDKKSKSFREFLDSVNGYSEKLPQDTFKSSGTMVNTRLVIINKEE